MIACVSKNQGIGLNGDLIVKSQKDMKRFAAKTKNKTVVMGFGTWKSLPTKALTNRRNIVVVDRFSAELTDAITDVMVTHNDGKTTLEVIGSVDEEGNYVRKEIMEIAKQEEVVIIGGQSMYELFIPVATKLYLTYVDMNLTADRFFPYFNTASWERTENRTVIDKIDKVMSTTIHFWTLERENPSASPVTFFKNLEEIVKNAVKNKKTISV